MSKARKSLMAFMILVGTCVAPMAALQSMGQELTDENGNVVAQNTAQSSSKKGGGFVDIVFGSGVVGMLLWFALFGDGALAIYFSVDCFILIKPEKLMPARLIDQVQKAMSEGDIVAAMEACQNTPSVMSNILTAAFQHVEEGFDVIQEAVNAASDPRPSRRAAQATRPRSQARSARRSGRRPAALSCRSRRSPCSTLSVTTPTVSFSA